MNGRHIHIGDVEEVLVDAELDHVQALVKRVGFLLGHRVVLPIDYVVDFDDEKIHVQLTDEEIESLENYEESSAE